MGCEKQFIIGRNTTDLARWQWPGKNLQGRGAFLLSRELRQLRQSPQTSAKPGITIPWHRYLNTKGLNILLKFPSHLAVTSHWMFLSYNYLIVCDASCAISCNVCSWKRKRYFVECFKEQNLIEIKDDKLEKEKPRKESKTKKKTKKYRLGFDERKSSCKRLSIQCRWLSILHARSSAMSVSYSLLIGWQNERARSCNWTSIQWCCPAEGVL